MRLFFTICFFLFLVVFLFKNYEPNKDDPDVSYSSLKNNDGLLSSKILDKLAQKPTTLNIVQDVLAIPEGYKAIKPNTGSFGEYVQHLKLSKNNVVYYHSGEEKPLKTHLAVIEMDNIGTNLQCADVIYRINAEYKLKNNIPIKYTHASGAVKKYENGDDFNTYLNNIYDYSNTRSLMSKDSKPVPLEKVRPGDILVNGDISPGHALLIAGIVKKGSHYKMAFIQGFMPAQSPHIVLNNSNGGPWFDISKHIHISGYDFDLDKHLKRML